MWSSVLKSAGRDSRPNFEGEGVGKTYEHLDNNSDRDFEHPNCKNLRTEKETKRIKLLIWSQQIYS